MPRGDSVGGSYLSYVSWNALQTASGSVAGVLSMQPAALPLAAATLGAQSPRSTHRWMGS